MLARAFCTLNGHLLITTTLTERQRELIILRVASVRQADYELAQHVLIARDAGLDEEQIARIEDGPDPSFWGDFESALLGAVDELLVEGSISNPTWSLLSAELDTQQLLDVIFTVVVTMHSPACCTPLRSASMRTSSRRRDITGS